MRAVTKVARAKGGKESVLESLLYQKFNKKALPAGHLQELRLEHIA